MFIHLCRTSAALAFAVGSLVVLATTVQAQQIRYLASFGDNANDCFRNSPCRTLQRGINETPDGGELQILDAGTFGNTATITKSITVSANGVAATAGAIEIDAPDATVALHGLLLNGSNAAAGARGIRVANAAAVHIAGCEIERFPDSGIYIEPPNVAVLITDTTVRGNSNHGLLVTTQAQDTRLTVSGSRFEGNGGHGVRVVPSGHETTITRVAASGNIVGIANLSGRMNIASTTAANNGLHGYVTAGGEITIEDSVATANGSKGLVVASGGIARISDSVFTNNNTGLYNTSAALLSRGNNIVHGNVNDTTGVITPLPAK